MEQLAADLQAMDDQSRSGLSKALKLVSSAYEKDMTGFVAGLPDLLGI